MAGAKKAPRGELPRHSCPGACKPCKPQLYALNECSPCAVRSLELNASLNVSATLILCRLSAIPWCARLRVPGIPHQQRSKQGLARQAVRLSGKVAGPSGSEAHQHAGGACRAMWTGAASPKHGCQQAGQPRWAALRSGLWRGGGWQGGARSLALWQSEQTSDDSDRKGLNL